LEKKIIGVINSILGLFAMWREVCFYRRNRCLISSTVFIGGIGTQDYRDALKNQLLFLALHVLRKLHLEDQ